MKRIIKNVVTFLIALSALVIGLIWAMKSNWDWEPILVISVAFFEIILFVFFRSDEEHKSSPEIGFRTDVKSENEEKRKALVRILFIDDKHTDFKMVSILKKSGWINTKSTKDITDLDDPKVLEADIIFVDINGVGTTMFQDQGLGLASALKKKYGSKRIVLYSAETTGDRFHKALREVDDCLPKNAEPYQFINLIESFSK